ncbi:MAG TPA: glycosyltransferase family 4 protein [Clostridiaceae bacterium]
MLSINMLSSAHNVKGQGVLSAYCELLSLVKNSLNDDFEVTTNTMKLCDITHYHTIDFKFFLSIPFTQLKGTNVAYVHFVPETVEESLKLPWIAKKVFYKYIIWFYKGVDHLVVVNPYFKKVLEGYGIESDKITYIPNFVANDNFYKTDKDTIDNLRDELGIDRNKFVVLGVGQIQTRKGILDFIKVANSMPDIQFVWAGGFSFGNFTEGYSELKKIVECPPKNVKFLGIVEREEMNDIYNIADMMFLPSFNELFPMAILEAMNLNLPILLRDLDIYPDILFDYYLKGIDTSDFESKIREISLNKESYNFWSEKSHEGNLFYSKKRIAILWKKFYKKIYIEKLLLKYTKHVDGTN